MMKPSRTRDERKNPTIYTPEEELRYQLEQQANQKRKQKLYDALKEKQEILDHYASHKLPAGESDAELANFLAQKQQELDVLSKQLESQDPEFALAGKPEDKRELKRKEVFNPVFYDNFFQKNDSASNQARIVSQGELDREKRLKLREEERMRRLAGIKESAYDDKPYLAQPQPLPEIKQSFQPGKNAEFQMPPYLKQESVRASDSYGDKNQFDRKPYDRFESLPPIGASGKSETERAAMKEALFGGPSSGAGGNNFNDMTEEKENTPMNRAQQLRTEVQENRFKEGIDMPERQERETMESRGGARGATPKNDPRLEKNEVQGAGGMFNKLGGGANQGNLTDAEKKRKYKEELDALVQQKKGMGGGVAPAIGGKGNNIREFERMASREEAERPMNIVRQSSNLQAGPGAGGNLPPVKERGFSGIGGGADKAAMEREEKNKRYAEELRQEIAAKEREKERQKQERRVGSAMAANRRDVAEYAGQYQSESRTVQDVDVNTRRDENRRQSSMGGGNMTPQNDSEIDKKKKYREFLDAQVEEKKRIQSAKQGRRENPPLPSLPNAGAGVGGRNNYHEEERERYDMGRERMETYESQGGYERKAEIPTPKSDIRVGGGNEGGGFFLHKAEDEEKKRAEMRNLQKQRMAEELKKQMEENEEKKRREKQKKTEEDLRERERIEREADEEKRRQEQEIQKKQELERKNREPASGPSQNNNFVAAEPEPQYARQASREEEPAQYNRLQNIPDQDYGSEQMDTAPPLRDDSDLSRRRKEDLGEHHPYLSKQDFYRSGNEAPAGQRIAFDPNLFPQQGGQYGQNVPGYGSYGSYGSVPGAGGMMPPPQMMGYPPMHMGYMAPPPVDFGANMYQEMTNYQQLMQQVMDERLKIERIAMEEQMLLDQYHTKIKEMKLEKMQYERECERIRLMIQGQIPVTNSVFMDNNKLGEKARQMEKQLNALSNSYLPTLMNLKNIKASYVSNYNKLLAQSQQSLMPRGFNPLQAQNQNQTQNQNQNQSMMSQFQDNLAMGETFKTQSAMEESGMFRQSLPAASNFNNLLSRGEFDKSYLKDFEAYNQMKQQEENLFTLQQQLQNNPSNFSATLPQATEFRPIEAGGLDNIEIRDEGSQVMMRKTPDLDENKIKQRQMETTPQVIYDKSQFQTQQKEREQRSELKETSDFDSHLKQGLPVDSNLSAFRMSPKIGGGKGEDESMIGRRGEQYLSFNHNAIPVVHETDRKQQQHEKSEQEFLDAFDQSAEKKFNNQLKPREEATEVKIGEGRSQKSLVLAEDTMDYKQQEEYDDFLQSNDNAIEELRLGLFKSGEKNFAFDAVKEDDEDKRGTGFRSQYEKDMISPRTIQGDKKYRGPKTIDPFAKVMKSEIRTSRGIEKEESMFNYKEEEDRIKEKSYNEVSKISGFIMESGRKPGGYEGKNERFEPVMMKEEVFEKDEEEDNEAYDDDYEKISEKIDEKKSVDEEIEEDYALEFEDYDDMGNTMKSKKGATLRGTGMKNFKGIVKSPEKEVEKISPEKGKKVVSFDKDSEEKAPRVKTADLEALVGVGKGGFNKAAGGEEEGQGKDKRSRTILDRLQRLLDDWEEEKEDEQIKIKEIGEKMEEFEKNKKDKDLFKPFGGNANRHSNRYSREGGL